MVRAATCQYRCAGQAAVSTDSTECTANGVQCSSTTQPCTICPPIQSPPVLQPVYIAAPTSPPFETYVPPPVYTYVEPPVYTYVEPPVQYQPVYIPSTSTPVFTYVEQPVQYQPVYIPQPIQYQTAQPIQYQTQPIQYQTQPMQYQTAQPIQYQTQPIQYQTVVNNLNGMPQFYRNLINQCIDRNTNNVVLDALCSNRRRSSAADATTSQGPTPLVIALSAGGALTILAAAAVVFNRIADKRVAHELFAMGLLE
jgi:hypothetical protein